MRKLFIFVFIGVSLTSFAQDEELKNHCKTLCSPEFQGRGYVNKGDSIAAEYIAGEFTKLGLKKYKKSYFQSFFLDVNTFPGEMSIVIDANTLVPGKDYIVDPASAGGKLTLQPKEIAYNLAFDQEKLAQELQIVLTSGQYNSIVIDLSKVPHDSIRKKLRGLSQELAALLPVFEITDQKFTYSVEAEQLNYPLVYLKPGFWVEGQSVEINIDALKITNYNSRNVIGYLKGKKAKGKTIVYSAHYDHLGRMGRETYFPGGNDNASGTSMLLTMASYFKQHRPNYNVVFMAFAGEEAGLIGSHYYVEHPLFPLEKISFLLNLDIMGSGEDGVTIVNATSHEREFQLLQSINEEQQLLKQIKSRSNAPNSDHYWFAKNEVPCFFMYTMGPNNHYHDVFDTYEELSFAETKDITTLLIEFGQRFFVK
ncbi:MAG: M28 family peptidase [Bacteroidota bacterium]